jgi:eukaryotic-like serine/threonine-protein kinase
MNAERWERIQAVFHEVVNSAESDRRALVEAACGDDRSLAADVLALLEEDARSASLLDGDISHFAVQLLDGSRTSIPFPEFGPYKIKGILGEGGMGVVYLAERREVQSLVAIKVLRDAWLSPARRERFEIEQRTLAQLNHPTIARLYDLGVLPDGTPWFVMEYVKGTALTAYCRDHKSSIEERLRLFRAVCEAVQYAHAQAIIHRDVKPSNILVKEDGTVKLLDFGIAKQLENAVQPADQSQTIVRLMTPAYAAPEQVRGERVGTYTDVYSLGVILYELLTGQLPLNVSNLTPGEAETMLVHHEPEKPSVVARKKVNSHEPQTTPVDSKSDWNDLDVLCLTAMHKDTHRRYQSAEALIRDIDHFQKSEPLEARPDSLRYTAGKFIRRNPRPLSIAALIFTLVVGLVIFFTVRLAKARNAAVAETARTQRVEQFMENLFEGGDKESGPTDDLRVVTVLDRAVREAHLLKKDPEVQADLYQTLGSAYLQLGNLDRADTLVTLALKQRRATSRPDDPALAETLVTMGDLDGERGQPGAGEPLIRQGLAIYSAHRPIDHARLGSATSALGEVLMERGAYREAASVLNQAVVLQSEEAAASPGLADTLTTLATTQADLGQYDLAEASNLRSLAIDRKLYGENNTGVDYDLINLGLLEEQRGRYAKAEQYEREALAISEARYGKNHYDTASFMAILGGTLTHEDRYQEATGLFQQALAVQERVYGNASPHVAATLTRRASLEIKEGSLGQAERDSRRAAAIYRSAYGARNFMVALANSRLAEVYLHKKRFTQAEQLFREVILRLTESLSADNIETAVAQVKLGRTLLRERRYQEAEAETRAGYETLIRRTSPSEEFVQDARQDLAAEYEALNQPQKAKEFQAKLAVAHRKPHGLTSR